MRESSIFRPSLIVGAARRLGFRFAFSNAEPPPLSRRGIVRNSSTSWLNHRCLGGAGRAGPSAFLATPNSRTFQRGAGALGFASPSLTKGWDLPPRARRPSCETRPRLGKNLSLARARGADSSAFWRFAYFADYPAGRARRGRLTPPKTERGSFPTKPSLPKNRTPARASLRDSLSLGGYSLGFPPSAGVSPCLGHCPAFAGRAGRARVGGCAYKLPRSVR